MIRHPDHLRYRRVDKNINLLEGESAQAFLRAVYQSLGYEEGTLLRALTLPEPESEEEKGWVENGDWLTLAHKAGVERIFFVSNDPVIVFSAFDEPPDEENLRDTFRRVWCLARPQCLFLALPGELRVYSLNHPPARDLESWKELKPLEIIERATDVAEKLENYHRDRVESGQLFLDENFGELDQRADRQLIQDLRVIRQALLDSNLAPQYAHALIARSIFIRYLEDRGVLTPAFFEQIAEGDLAWKRLVNEPLEKPNLTGDWSRRRYDRVLRSKGFTYALFRKLADHFNGDLFPREQGEEHAVKQVHLDLLRAFLLGDTNQDQSTLFFWAYDFSIIPIDLISSIYEEFYHSGNSDDKGTHYTPNILVEYILSRILTPERLATKPRIIDPACGSGIFLVEAFRRIVRFQTQREGKIPSASELRLILRDQIAGIEINREAIHIAAFSLYLALLNYQYPPDILNSKRLPHLISQFSNVNDPTEENYSILINANAFALTDEEWRDITEWLEKNVTQRPADLRTLLDANNRLAIELHNFDVVVGNPPWFEAGGKVQPVPCSPINVLEEIPKPLIYDESLGTISSTVPLTRKHFDAAMQILPAALGPALEELKKRWDESYQAVRWARVYDRPIGDKSYSQLFIHRALSLAKENGAIGLLLHSSVLFNRRSTSRAFRESWLCSSTIIEVVNFAHARKLFFDISIAPFAFALFSPATRVPPTARVIYKSLKATQVAERRRSLDWNPADRHIVSQFELKRSDYLWKTYWWGGHGDAALIAALEMESPLSDLLDPSGPEPGYGFQLGDKPPTDYLRFLRPLRSKTLKWYGPVRDEWFEKQPQGVKREPDERLYVGQRLLVTRGVKAAYGPIARLETDEFSFRHTIYCVPLQSLPDWKAKIVLGIFLSSLGRYRLFMTSGSWGPWYDQTVPNDILSMPIRTPAPTSAVAKRIISTVDAIRLWESTSSGLFARVGRKNPPDKETVRNLDDAIFELFDLSEPERNLVQDFFSYNFDLFILGAKSSSLRRTRTQLQTLNGTLKDLRTLRRPEQELEQYIYAFLEMWNPELEPEGEFFWQVIRHPDARMLGIVFNTKRKSIREEQISVDEGERWNEVLKRLDRAMLQPISRNVFTEGMIRVVTDTFIAVIKRDQRRLWTPSMAREDAEATLLQAIHLQAATAEETK